MPCKRIIPCLDVKDGQVVKGVQFRKHEIVGDVLQLAQKYRDQGADELVFYDIVASSEQRIVESQWISQIAKFLDIPFCVAGGLRSRDQVRMILNCGADKVSINSPALENPELIRELASEFGSQCVVVSVDSRRQDNGDFDVYQYTGDEAKTIKTKKKMLAWIQEAQALGAGEIVLNCMDNDGTGLGYDLNQLKLARAVLSIPLVASGGARTVQDFIQVFKQADVDAALAAGVFHRGELELNDLKKQLRNSDIEVRQ
jgi:imidazole glycerol-phosphate synthase subunit HisF